MLFNSFEFLIFFILTTGLYFVVEHKYRWGLLLTASCIFYMYFIPVYILILFFTIIIDYLAGIGLEKVGQKHKKPFLIASLVANIGILAVFKYYNFFIDNINELAITIPFLKTNLPHLEIILPIGLSFHTFQAMSYTIEVYRGNQKAEKHFGIYALYVMFYPQLVAGPIERPQNMLHQFHEEKKFNYENLFSGLKFILWGLFKKVVVADRLAILVDYVYNDPVSHRGFALVIATVLFAIQIYCDFSGYSDIALGCARIMGFKLMVNFMQPYFSKSISEFWTRWHISLSTWFKDYLYIPLGGNKVAIPRWYFNILFVFLVSGFWHGANWTFIIWGGLHGIFLIIASLQSRYLKSIKISSVFQVFITFTLVSLSWIFFRAASLQDAIYIVTNLLEKTETGAYFTLSKSDLHGLPDTYLGQAKWKFALSITLVPLLLLADWLILSGKAQQLLLKSAFIRFPIYYILILSILFLGVFDTKQFIYFQF